MLTLLKVFLQDHCQWYRRMKGGRWARWNGFWEQEQKLASLEKPVLYYKRRFRGIDLAEGLGVWDYKQILDWDCTYISAREDYRRNRI